MSALIENTLSNLLMASEGRTLNYLRLSVTDLCNLRCRYCMPPGGVPKLAYEEILRYEEIFRLLGLSARLGLEKLRLTGGEPLLRKGLIDFIRRVHEAGFFRGINLTTNAVLLAPLAERLKAAGVTAVNISLDSLDPDIYAHTVGRPGAAGRDFFRQAWAGFQAALDAGFESVKINCVPVRGQNEGGLSALARLALEYPVEVRFIEHMPVGTGELWKPEGLIASAELKARLEEDLGVLEPAPRSGPAGPAQVYRPSGAPGRLGFISAMSEHFCNRCNRLRLTADGKLKPCLLSPVEIDLKAALRSGADDAELLALFRLAAAHKPADHQLAGPAENARQMSRIGG